MKNNLLKVLSCATLLLGTVNNASYTMEDNVMQGNEQLLNYKSIMKCLQSKCTPNKLNEIKNEINENNTEICNFCQDKNIVVNDQQIEIANNILQNSDTILNNISSICGFDILEFYRKNKDIVHKYEELSMKLKNIKQDRIDIEAKINLIESESKLRKSDLLNTKNETEKQISELLEKIKKLNSQTCENKQEQQKQITKEFTSLLGTLNRIETSLMHEENNIFQEQVTLYNKLIGLDKEIKTIEVQFNETCKNNIDVLTYDKLIFTYIDNIFQLNRLLKTKFHQIFRIVKPNNNN